MPRFDQSDPSMHGPRRRRRRRELLEDLQQRRSVAAVPLVNVGRRLREIRLERQLSIRDLARISGLNVNTVSIIENDKASPSLETLQQLALALDVSMAAFFEQSSPRQQIVHFKADQRPRVNFSHGVLEDLGPGTSRCSVETFLVTLDPFSSSGEDAIVHAGYETVYCLEGNLTYIIDDQDFLLQPGDSLFFEAPLPHRWQNNGAEPVRSLFVLSPADEKEPATERHFAPILRRLEEQ